MTRKGKIARLPYHIRFQLNRRLFNGESGKQLVQWLNQQEDVKDLLTREFAGRPVTEQNLSEWKTGGYLDWLRSEQTRQVFESVADQCDEFDPSSSGLVVNDRVAGWFSREFVAFAKSLLEEKMDHKEKWRCLREILHELSHLRRDDHSAVRAAIKRTDWIEALEEKYEAERDESEFRVEMNKIAAAAGWLSPSMRSKLKAKLATASPDEPSDQIKPNPAKSD